MAAADVQQPPTEPAAPEPAPAVPDYLASPNAVFGDQGVQWRYGKAPDYSKTRAVWEQSKKMNHTAGSLPQLVENLVKNWEVEASFKPRLQDWRTIDHANYTFAINGGPPQSAEHMLKVGTYNAIIAPNEYYSPETSDFASSHKTFKRMMPTFAWEVIEVYSGPPQVAFRWRHWGEMKSDYVGFNDKGEKITAKAHGGTIDIEGVTVAQVDDKVRLQKVETWFDPMEMFRQIAPKGIVNKQVINSKVSPSDALDNVPDNNGVKIAEEHNSKPSASEHQADPAPESVIPKDISDSTGLAADAYVPHQGTKDAQPELAAPQAESAKATEATASSVPPAEAHDAVQVHPGHTPATPAEHIFKTAETHGTNMPIARADGAAEQTSALAVQHTGTDDLSAAAAAAQPELPKQMEEAVAPAAGEAVAVPPHDHETRMTHEEMSRISPAECPFLMNRE